MTTISLTSTTASGYLQTDFDQQKALIDGQDTGDLAANTVHRSSDGKNHSDVVLNNTHRTSNGSDHTYIDQDVTSGSSPTFSGTNFTGVMKDLVDDITPQLGGNLDYNSKGISIPGQTVGGSDGDAVYLSGSETWSQTDASAEATAKGLVGIRVSATEVMTQGVYVTTGLTAGSTYYLSETAGAITTTAPTTSGAIVRIAGVALSTTKLYVAPETTYVEKS